MYSKNDPLIVDRKANLPLVYGDTPSFLGGDVVGQNELVEGYDVTVAGACWEGTITWGSYSGCELAPRSVRHASARYGGFLPEYGSDLFDHLKLCDMGDIPVNTNDPAETMQNIYSAASRVYQNNSIPVVLGGDHSITPEIVKGLAHNRGGKVGIIHFDAHLDNSESFGEDEFPRCGPINRLAKLEQVRNESIVHIGIRGPRNSETQFSIAQEMGSTIFHMGDIRNRGIQRITEEALEIASQGTDHIYVTICSDCIDAGFNPGGPKDFNGLHPNELFWALHQMGEFGFAGLDYVEVYPLQDPTSTSSHLVSWALIYALHGLAMHKSRLL